MESYESKYVANDEKKTDLSKSLRYGKVSKLLGLQSTANISLCAQAAFFVHNPSSHTFSIFECKYFQNMMIVMANNFVEKNSKVPILNSKQIKHYIEAEYMQFQNRLSKMISDQVVEAKRNAFCQLIIDAVTLVNKKRTKILGYSLPT